MPDGMSGPWEAYQSQATSQPSTGLAAPTGPPTSASLNQPSSAPADGPWAQYAPPSASSAQPSPAAPSASGQVIDPTGYPLVQDDLTTPQPPQAKAQPDGILARADNVVRTIANAATFGLGKNIDAAEEAFEQPLFHAGADAPTFSQRYAQNLADEKARLAAVPTAVRVPLDLVGGAAGAFGAGEVAGAVDGAARLIPGANALLDAGSTAAQPVVNALGRVPGLLPTARAAAGGAAFGAAQGAGDTDGGLQDRLAGARTGAEVGAVVGPLAEGAGNLLASGWNSLAARLSEAGFGTKQALVDAQGQPIIGTNNLAVSATPGVTRVAGQQVADSASDLPAVQNALAQPSILVPGSQPTTFQATGDTGLGQAELALRNTPGSSQAFLDRANQQNAARVGAIESAAPADSSTSDLANTLEQIHAGLQAQQEASASQAGQGNLQGIGGATDSTPTQAGAALRGAVDQARAPAIQAADQAVQVGQQQASAAADALGGVPTGDTGTDLQRLGQALRAPLSAGDQAAKANVTRLANAIDPNGTLGVDMTPIRAQAKSILADISPNAAQPTGAEASILNTAANLPDVQSFKDLAALRQQVTDTIRGARSVPERAQEVRRLSMLLDGVHDTMSDAVSNPSVPMPAVSAPIQAAAPHVGSDVFTPSGQRVGVQYEVANAPDLIASHNADLTPNPAFPSELQPRARDRAASEVQIAKIASKLQPERLGASSTVADGAPIVGPDNVVESGNGRVLGLRRAYDANGPQASSYRDWLASQGHDTAGMDQPVLIRRRTTDLTPEQRVSFAAEGNAPTTLAMSAPEQAAGDARNLSAAVLDTLQPGDITSPANRDFVRSFARNVVDPGQSGSFAAADGSLSAQGAARVRAALVHRAYGDSGLTASLAESTDPTAKVLAGAMQDAAGPMARLRAGIEAGHVDPGVDIAPSLVEAAQAVKQARQKGLSLSNAVAQRDAFNQLSPEAEMVLKGAYGPNLSGRMSQQQVGDMLASYAKRAGEQSSAGSLFGPNLSATELLDGVIARYGKTASGEAGGAASDTGSIRQGNGGYGNQARGSVDGSRGQATPGGSGGQRGATFARILEQPSSSLTPNFDQAAADRYAAMRSAHAERKWTYGARAPGVGAVLAPGDRAGTFKLSDSAVPSAIFAKGAGGGDRVQAALRAGSTPKQIADAAAFSLRQAASKDGIIDPAAATRWRKQHAEAFQALTQADPKIGKQFDIVQQMGAHLFHLQAQRAALDAAHPLNPGWGDSEVMARVWKPGPSGADAIKSVTSAAKGSPVAASSIADYAAYSLRKDAAPNGVLDPAKYASWSRNFDGALSARPDIKGQFDTLAKAQATLNDTAANHAQALKDFQASAARHFLGDRDQDKAIGRILAGPTSAADMRSLAAMTAKDPAAQAGIQRAVVDHIQSRLTGNNLAGQTGTEKLKSDQFQTFMRRALPALREVMSKNQIDGLTAVAEDLQRANLSVDGVRAGGGSDTTQKAALLAQGGGMRSLLSLIRSHGMTAALTFAGAHLGSGLGALLGNKAGVALAGMKAAGIKQTSDLVTEAMLNPALARVLLSNVTAANSHNVASAFASQVGRIAAARAADLQPAKRGR